MGVRGSLTREGLRGNSSNWRQQVETNREKVLMTFSVQETETEGYRVKRGLGGGVVFPLFLNGVM